MTVICECEVTDVTFESGSIVISANLVFPDEETFSAQEFQETLISESANLLPGYDVYAESIGVEIGQSGVC